jgi:hypothetical protein
MFQDLLDCEKLKHPLDCADRGGCNIEESASISYRYTDDKKVESSIKHQPRKLARSSINFSSMKMFFKFLYRD